MREPYGEGLASHAGPESCDRVRKGTARSVDRGCVGWVLSREIVQVRSADELKDDGRQHRTPRQRERGLDSARSETPCTHAQDSLYGNWEVPRPASSDGGEVRTVNPIGARR